MTADLCARSASSFRLSGRGLRFIGEAVAASVQCLAVRLSLHGLVVTRSRPVRAQLAVCRVKVVEIWLHRLGPGCAPVPGSPYRLSMPSSFMQLIA